MVTCDEKDNIADTKERSKERQTDRKREREKKGNVSNEVRWHIKVRHCEREKKDNTGKGT